MKKRMMRIASTFGVTAGLTGCVHSTGQIATINDEKDAQMFAAKPGLARLYVVQGLERMGDAPSDVVLATGPAGSPQMVGAAAGLAIAALIKAGRDKPEAPVIPPDPMDRDNKLKHWPIPIPNDIFVNDKKVGTVGHLQYVALDLPPATYVIKVLQATTWHQPFDEKTLTLKKGEVAYLMNTELAYYGTQKNERAIVDCQAEDCQAYVLAGHRVVADWK